MLGNYILMKHFSREQLQQKSIFDPVVDFELANSGEATDRAITNFVNREGALTLNATNIRQYLNRIPGFTSQHISQLLIDPFHKLPFTPFFDSFAMDSAIDGMALETILIFTQITFDFLNKQSIDPEQVLDRFMLSYKEPEDQSAKQDQINLIRAQSSGLVEIIHEVNNYASKEMVVEDKLSKVMEIFLKSHVFLDDETDTLQTLWDESIFGKNGSFNYIYFYWELNRPQLYDGRRRRPMSELVDLLGEQGSIEAFTAHLQNQFKSAYYQPRISKLRMPIGQRIGSHLRMLELDIDLPNNFFYKTGIFQSIPDILEFEGKNSNSSVVVTDLKRTLFPWIKNYSQLCFIPDLEPKSIPFNDLNFYHQVHIYLNTLVAGIHMLRRKKDGSLGKIDTYKIEQVTLADIEHITAMLQNKQISVRYRSIVVPEKPRIVSIDYQMTPQDFLTMETILSLFSFKLIAQEQELRRIKRSESSKKKKLANKSPRLQFSHTKRRSLVNNFILDVIKHIEP